MKRSLLPCLSRRGRSFQSSVHDVKAFTNMVIWPRLFSDVRRKRRGVKQKCSEWAVSGTPLASVRSRSLETGQTVLSFGRNHRPALPTGPVPRVVL
ncbi:hypothetical protein DPX16_10476 [Anabarilius grahami]|uniref:Uncharacterized protein n=1 Tax=Anabarilius grahami TaxID=495550 RepID=A0A3N0Z6V1_ANAGA|nr:hypothetical protein DPX16_10476 [Anabarilius grahami]